MRSYTCGTCGGPHPMERCPTTSPVKWCNVCQKMTNHETKNFYYWLRAKFEERIGQAATFERPKPVLWAQPPFPSAIGVRMTEVGEFDMPNQLVPSMPYHDDGYYTDGIYEEDYNWPLMIMDTGRGRTLDAFAWHNFVSNETCYCCECDHFI